MTIHERRTWHERLAGWCVWSVILAAAAWWFAHRERPVTARERLAVVRDTAAHENRRRIAADYLQHADASIVPELVEELRNGDRVGRELAALALGRLGEKADAAIEPLARAAGDPEAAVRRQAIVALGRIKTRPDAAVAGLLLGANDEDTAVRDAAFAALGWFGAPGIAKLVQLAGEDDADARRRAVIELGRAGIDSEEVLAALRQRLADADPRVRAESFAAQCNLLEFDIDRLVGSLKTDRHPLVRMTALRVLAKWPEKTAEIFIPALNDEDKSIQRAAIGQLGQLDAEAQAAVPALANLLDSDDRDTAWAASRALGHIGPAARGAIERLLVCLSDRDFHVRSFANHALRRIGREGQMRPPQLFAALKADGNSARSLIFWAPDPPSAGTAGQVPVGQRPAGELGYGITDADLEHVRDLTHLVALNLTDNPVGDAGLANLADLKELKYLYLRNTNVTSAGLRHLAGLTSLERLDLGACAITDDGMTHLADLRSLRDLVLYGTQVTDAGLAHLQSLTTLEDISLPDLVTLKGLAPLGSLTVIDRVPKSTSDDDLPSLLPLTRLRTLVLLDAAITDNGLETVGKLSSIEDLDLRRTQVTDAGLAHLKSLSKLRFLWLEDTRVSKRGVEQLKESLPDLTVGGVPDVTVPRHEVEYEVIGLKPVVAIRP